MKKKFSLNEILHKDRIMIVVSLLLAIVVWAIVSFGPGNVQTRPITATVKLDLTDTSAGYNDLRVIGRNTFEVSVVVEGTRSVIYSLTADDLEIKPSLTDIQGPGKSYVSLSVNRVGKTTGYTINSISPSTVEVECDYWSTATFTVAPDVKLLSVADEKAQQLGDIVLDSAAVTEGRVQLEGPRSVVSRVASVVARVNEAQVLNKTTRCQATLLALDESGAEVDLSQCVFTNIAGNTVDMTVPVWVQKKVNLTYKLANVPAGISQTGLVTLPYSSITLVGEEDALTTAAQTIGNLGTFDFEHLSPDNKELSITLSVPTGVKVLEGNTVTVSIGVADYTTRTMSYNVRGLQDVTVENLPTGKTITLQAQKLTDIVLCGKAATLRRLTVNDLKVTLDASSNTGTGSVRYTVHITVPKHDDIWVYYGSDATVSPYQLYGTLE